MVVLSYLRMSPCVSFRAPEIRTLKSPPEVGRICQSDQNFCFRIAASLLWFHRNLEILKRLLTLNLFHVVIWLGRHLLLVCGHPKAVLFFKGRADGHSVFPDSPPGFSLELHCGDWVDRGFRVCCFSFPPKLLCFSLILIHYRGCKFFGPWLLGGFIMPAPFLLLLVLVSAARSLLKGSTDSQFQK